MHNQTTTWRWGLLAGLVASLCCVGPSATVLLGLGASSALFGLQLDRGITAGIGLAMLLLGVLLGWRRARICALRAKDRWRQPVLLLASGALSYILLGVALPSLAVRALESSPPVAAQPAPTALRRLTLSVAKMDCPPCAATVRSMLQRQPAVSAFFAEVYVDQVTIDYDPAQVRAEELARKLPRKYGVLVLSDTALP